MRSLADLNEDTGVELIQRFLLDDDAAVDYRSFSDR